MTEVKPLTIVVPVPGVPGGLTMYLCSRCGTYGFQSIYSDCCTACSNALGHHLKGHAA